MNSLLALTVIAGTWSYGSFTAPPDAPKTPTMPVVKSATVQAPSPALQPVLLTCKKHGCKGHDCSCSGFDCKAKCEYAAETKPAVKHEPVALAERTPRAEPEPLSNPVAAGITPVSRPRVATVPPPQKWKCSTIDGQKWEHTDKRFLERWCDDRNATIYAAQQAALRTVVTTQVVEAAQQTYPYEVPTANCASGRCARRP